MMRTCTFVQTAWQLQAICTRCKHTCVLVVFWSRRQVRTLKVVASNRNSEPANLFALLIWFKNHIEIREIAHFSSKIFHGHPLFKDPFCTKCVDASSSLCNVAVVLVTRLCSSRSCTYV